MTENEIEEIAWRFFQGKATPEEERRLHQWFDGHGNRQDEAITVGTGSEDRAAVKDRLYAAIRAKITQESQTNGQLKHKGRRWLHYAAASILLLLSVGGIYYFVSDEDEQPVRYTQLLDGDVGPGSNNAVLELADGSVINLDDVAIGEMNRTGGMQFEKQADGVLTVGRADADDAIVPQYHTIKTPAGGQYQVELPDGTNVWLNASSSIVFPTVFDNAYREVSAQGEVYFEVAHLRDESDVAVPFFVVNSGHRVEVLGTKFNVSDYPGERIRTVLVEGSVRVHSLQSAASVLLKPGEQADGAGDRIAVSTADLESAIAWKNGDFIFNNETLPSIMKKLERWYDIDVDYNGTAISRKFSGAISRSRNLSDVLNIMEYTGAVTFKIEGRRVTVMM